MDQGEKRKRKRYLRSKAEFRSQEPDQGEDPTYSQPFTNSRTIL